MYLFFICKTLSKNCDWDLLFYRNNIFRFHRNYFFLFLKLSDKIFSIKEKSNFYIKHWNQMQRKVCISISFFTFIFYFLENFFFSEMTNDALICNMFWCHSTTFCCMVTLVYWLLCTAVMIMQLKKSQLHAFNQNRIINTVYQHAIIRIQRFYIKFDFDTRIY